MSSHLGYSFATTYGNTGISNVAAINATIPAPGIWLICYTLRMYAGTQSVAGSGTISRFFTSVGISTGAVICTVENSATQTLTASQYVANSASASVVISNSTTTVNLSAAVIGSTLFTNSDSYMQFTRIG